MSEDKFTQSSTNPEALDNNETNVIENETEAETVGSSSEYESEKSEKSSEQKELLEQEEPSPKEPKNKPGRNIHKYIRIACVIGFFVFSALLINEVIIQPWRIKESIDKTRDLYDKPSQVPSQEPINEVKPTNTPDATPTPDPNRDSQGRLLQFQELLDVCDDVKGWITIPDTNIDYVVTQGSEEEPDYYLDKDIEGNYSKAGTLYLDIQSSVEDKTPNLVIHGHNMVSTVEKMFHYLLNYKKASYYKEHPLIQFDTIYDTGQWKVFAVIVTNGSSKNEPLFDYRQSTFQNSSEFLNFIYQIRIRSVLNIDAVDINENDQILTLSTCSYELDNYRTVIFARRVRDDEDASVDTVGVSKNNNPLYPDSYYKRNGGKAPVLPETFEDALANGTIKWYQQKE